MQEATNRREIEILEIGSDRLKASFGSFAVQHVDQCSPCDQAHRDHMEALAIGREVGRLNHFLPDATVEFGYRSGRFTSQHDAPLMNDRHPATKITDIRHNVSGKN